MYFYSYLLLIQNLLKMQPKCSSESSTSYEMSKPVLDKEEILQTYIPNKLHMCISSWVVAGPLLAEVEFKTSICQDQDSNPSLGAGEKETERFSPEQNLGDPSEHAC